MSHRSALLTRDAQIELAHRDAAARPRSFDAEAGTIEAVIASTTPVRRRDARGDYLEVLDPAGLDLASVRGVSVLDSHQQHGLEHVLGTIADAWREGDAIVARIRFSEREEVASTIADVAGGIIRHLSVGYEVAEWRDGTGADGRTRTAVRWRIAEASFVPVPADPACVTRTRGRDDDSGERMSRARQIRTLGQQAGAPTSTIDDLIDRGATVEQARNALLFDLVLRGRTEIRTSPHNAQSMDNPEAFIRAAGEALLARVTPGHQPSPQARQYVGMSCADLARECLRRAGISVTGMAAPALITRALTTTSDYPAVLADVLNKSLRDSYTAAPGGIRLVARQTTAADFRLKSRIMLDSSGFSLEKVRESGEFASGSFVEAKESYRVDTYGKIFGISRQALINDDLGAFTDISRRLGQAAAAFEAQFLVDLLVTNSGSGPTMDDSEYLFATAHGNLAGTGGGPDIETLSDARLALRRQTGPGGGPIDVSPRYLLVPPEHETVVDQLVTTLTATKTEDVNPFSRLQSIVEPRLTDADAWYLVGDPATIDGLEYAYLAGAPGPQTESRAGFEVDGVQTKVRLDYGAGFVDFRGWYRNPGK